MVKARPAPGGGRWVEISPHRVRGWLDGFYGRHDGATEQGLQLTGLSNGDTATLEPPPGCSDVDDVDGLLTCLARPPRIAVLLVRKGAAAVGVADGTTLVASKVERSYVQGRTAAGGWSQQRYAHRRANQTDAAVQRAADIAARVLLPYAPGGAASTDATTTTSARGETHTKGETGAKGETRAKVKAGTETGADPDGAVRCLVCGGDRLMIDRVLADRRLQPLAALRHPRLLEVAEPRLDVLREAVAAARNVRIHLVP